jgi:hypothetical protein
MVRLRLSSVMCPQCADIESTANPDASGTGTGTGSIQANFLQPRHAWQ